VVNAPTTAGSWNEVLGGEGGPVAIDVTSSSNSWYANNGAGVAIFHCSSTSACNAAGFGTTPVVGESQVSNDGLTMPYPAEFRVDAADATQLLIGTCRVWRGPASGSGWSTANAISPLMDGTVPTNSGLACDGKAMIRSLGALAKTGGGEVLYVGMAGELDGGGTVPGHIFSATVSSGGTVSAWTDLTYSPVTNSGVGFNPYGDDVSRSA
jgi:hypothetical protein